MLEFGFADFLYRSLTLSFKAQCLPQIERGGGLCLAGCHGVAPTQGYLPVCIWDSLLKFQGGWVVLDVVFDVFLHCYAVCLYCLHASNYPLC